MSVPDTAVQLLGLVRAVDPLARRHRAALGELPAGRLPWELGAALGEDPGGGMPVWVDRAGYLYTADYSPVPMAISAGKLLAWIVAPASWRGFGRWDERARSIGRRSWEALRRSGRMSAEPPPRDAPPMAWIDRAPAQGRYPLYSAVHPPTGDQLVTRDLSEVSELGYEQPRLIGYVIASAPVTGTLQRPRSSAAWASRYGEAVSRENDAYCAEDERAAAGSRTAMEGNSEVRLLFPLGHFYSPVYAVSDIRARHELIWPSEPRPTLELDWREEQQLQLCNDVFAKQPPLAFLAEPSPDASEYWAGNDQFSPLDAWVLAAMLRHLRPRRMIEIGSGFSSLVSARVNREDFERHMNFICIEPYPRQFLLDGLDGVTDLRVELIQDTPLEMFEQLGESDVLFVDTSHTVKTGNDVVWIFQEILPRLSPGVVIHVHDIFLPGDYPERWVYEGRYWNEVYLLRAFLAYNDSFEIVWSNQLMLQRHSEALLRAFPAADTSAGAGASIWLRRVR